MYTNAAVMLIDGNPIEIMCHASAEYTVDFDQVKYCSLADLGSCLVDHSQAQTNKTYLHQSSGLEILATLIIHVAELRDCSAEEDGGFTLGFVDHKKMIFELSLSSGQSLQSTEADELLLPCLDRWGAHKLTLRRHPHGRLWECTLVVNPDQLTVGNLLELKFELESEILVAPRVSGPRNAMELVRAGQAHRLLGERESEWLDSKGMGYDVFNKLTSNFQVPENIKIELSQDVAAFANTLAGLIILGIKTKSEGGVDVLSEVTPLPSRGQARVKSYLDILQNRIHPPLRDVKISVIPYGKGELVCIYIPRQLVELRPFLVRGAVYDDGKVQRSAISIVRRGHDGNVNVRPEEIHAFLVAGRNALSD